VGTIWHTLEPVLTRCCCETEVHICQLSWLDFVADCVHSKWRSFSRQSVVSVCCGRLHCYWVYFYQYSSFQMIA